jgi:hypothetical protein
MFYIYSVLSLCLSYTYESEGFWHFSVGTGTKEDESSTVHFKVAGFHHVTACFHYMRVLRRMNCLFLIFHIFFFGGGLP